jgi:twitching motility protein PilU
MHANNSYHALNRILGFYPASSREAVQRDVSVALKAMVSQRLVRTTSGQRTPACEVMVNTVRVSELIQSGNFAEIPNAMEQSISLGSQSFEQDLSRMIADGTVEQSEGLANADSASNLLWRLQNSEQEPAVANAAKRPDESPFALTLGP